MERSIMWVPWTGNGLEHLKLAQADGGAVVADGVVIGTENGALFRTRYVVRCDARWRLRELRVSPLGDGGEGLGLFADGEGNWTTATGEPAPGLRGCFEVDISATPFTNTLPIRRLDLEPGESACIEVAYVAVPEMSVEPSRQRYTRLERREGGDSYRFESLDGAFVGFTADLPVDADGLVLDYPRLFRRA